MKIVAVLLTLLVCANVSAQDWRDTLNMARSAYKLKDYKKAYKHYEKAQKGAPENVDLSDEMAQSAYKAGDYQAAEKIYQQKQGRHSNPKDKADNFHNLGNARMKSEDYQGAIDAYKDALRNNPKDDRTRYNLTEAMRKKKEEEQKKQKQSKNQDSGEGDSSDEGDGDEDNDSSDPKEESKKEGQRSNEKGGEKKKSSKGGGGKKRNSNQQNGKGQLSNKTADRMLDDLMKQEAETKRRMSGYSGGSGGSKSGKDW